VYDVVQLLFEVQKTWSFLENLFIQSEEVKKELPRESEQFVEIDREVKEIMLIGNGIRIAKEFCTQNNMLRNLEKIQAELKVCEKALNEFLDSKRKAYPRFYFVSINDLLDILSNGNSPIKINKHMSKIFQAIERLSLESGDDGERPTAIDMISCVGFETVRFAEPLRLVGKVEVYLQDVIRQMNATLKEIASDSFKAYSTMEHGEWIQRDPA